MRIVNIAGSRLHGNEGGTLSGPRALRRELGSKLHVLGKRRAVDSDVVVQVVVPRNAHDASAGEQRNCIGVLRHQLPFPV
jgi:hypothetical protein